MNSLPPVAQSSASGHPSQGTPDAADKRPAAQGTWQREAIRKLIHLGMVVLPAWVWWSPPSWRSRGLLLALLLVLGADLLRRVWKPWARWIDGWAAAYSRPREHHLWVGVHAMFVAAWILSWSVSRDIAVASLSYGVFGDAAAALIGVRRNNGEGSRASGKSLLGSTGCFLTCVAVGWLMFPGNRQMILLGAMTATILERFSGRIDDNLTMPLGAAIVLSLVA